jgi:hypothetical protein
MSRDGGAKSLACDRPAAVKLVADAALPGRPPQAVLAWRLAGRLAVNSRVPD